MLTRLSRADAGQHARHVGRHVPRPVQPDAARASPRREPAAALPDPRHAGPAVADQADVQGARTSTTSAIPPRQLQWFIAQREGGGPARRTRSRPATSSRAGRSSTTRCTTRMCQREGVVDFAELLLRSYELLSRQRRAARALPARASRTCSSTSSRTPTRCSTSGCGCSPARTRRCSRSATTTSRSTRSAAPRSPTCSDSSATSPRPSSRCT